MKWALIVSGVVSEVSEIDPTNRFHPGLAWVPCADDVAIGWSFDNDRFLPIAGPPRRIGAEEIKAECRRRLALGFDYQFDDARGVHHIATTPEDMAGWDEVTAVASAFIAIGSNEETITIHTDTGVTQVTATEWQHILVAAGRHRQRIWLASFHLQNQDPIPADFSDDSHWL